MRSVTVLNFLLVLLVYPTLSATYKVLLFSPTQGHSHVEFFGRIGDALIDAGHEVVMLIPVLNPDVQTNGTNRAEVIRHRPKEDYSDYYKLNIMGNPFEDHGAAMTAADLKLFRDLETEMCEGLLKDIVLLQELRERRFDVAMTETFDYCGFGLFRVLDIPAQIVATAVPIYGFVDNLFGFPEPYSYVPNMLNSFSDEMSYWERVSNIYRYYLVKSTFKSVLDQQNDLFRQYYGADFPCLEELGKKSALAFINSEEMIEFPRPIIHKIIYVGGIGLKKPNALNQELAEICDRSREGVVYLSFGSYANATLLPLSKKQAILAAIASFPEYQFIWKLELSAQDSQMFMNLPNVRTVKWVPQVDLLNHPKVKAFITHGGLNSLTEAVHSGTPLVVIPLFGDQMHNAATVRKREVAVLIEKSNITTESLTYALREVLYNEKYAKNTQRLARMIAKKPMTAKDLVVKWTEFVAEFKDLSNLDVAGRDFGFIKYFCIDIIVPAACLILFSVCVFVKIGLLLLNRVIVSMNMKNKTD